jgi:hypothetical protein
MSLDKAGNLERFERTQQVVVGTAATTWTCGSVSVTGLSTDQRPQLNVTGRESVPMSNQTGSGPLIPGGSLVAIGGDCTANSQCASGQCDPGKKRCVPAVNKGKEGDYCTNHGQCLNDVFTHLMCSENKCILKYASGHTCPDDNFQCMSGSCDSGPGSGGTNKCVPKPGTGQGGEYCSLPAHCGAKQCINHACPTLKKLGQSCPQGNTQCESGFCDTGPGTGGTNKCVPQSGWGKPGEYCSQNGHCKPGKACVSNKCQ